MAFVAIFGIALLGLHVQGQESGRRSGPIRKIYVDAFQGKFDAAQLQEEVTERLRASRKIELVKNASDADAVVQGDGDIWVEGYQRIGAHGGGGMRQAIYNGYLSVEVRNRNGETLWSYLVTPSRMRWQSIDEDMADHIVRLLLPALARASAPKTHPETGLKSQIALTGAGSTFAAPLYQESLQMFENRQPEIHATYSPVGSESGIRQLEEGKVDFAGSDVSLSSEQMSTMPVKFRQFATVLGGVVPAYNLAGVGSWVRFTPGVLADIYLGRIRKWNDPRLRVLNHGIQLPDEPIMVFHRSDGSGTSFAWTDFLSRTSADWKAAVGTGMRVAWPTGEGAAGNEGVAADVAKIPGAIGYMELTYAVRHELSFGLVQNAAGKFVQANLSTLSAAAHTVPQRGDYRVSLVNAPGKDAYPIATFTWMLIPNPPENPQKAEVLEQFLRWLLTTGQRECSGLGYLPLPRQVAAYELEQLKQTDASVPSALTGPVQVKQSALPVR